MIDLFQSSLDNLAEELTCKWCESAYSNTNERRKHQAKGADCDMTSSHLSKDLETKYRTRTNSRLRRRRQPTYELYFSSSSDDEIWNLSNKTKKGSSGKRKRRLPDSENDAKRSESTPLSLINKTRVRIV